MPLTDTVSAPPPQSRFLLPVAYLALAALVTTPLFWTPIPVLIDYPNHLARSWLMAQAEMGNASAHYAVRWQWVPNLAMELFVPTLIRWFGLETASRLFVAATILLPVAGTALIHRALFGRVGWWPLAAFLFVYNSVLQWGFMNFLFGMGVALILFGAWLATRAWRMPFRLVLFALAAIGLFLLHLVAFGIYGLLIGAHAAGNWLREGEHSAPKLLRDGMDLGQFLPALLLWAATSTAGGPTHTEYGTLTDKLYAFTAPMGFGVVGPILGFTCFPLAYLAWRARWLRFSPAIGVPVLVLLLAGLAMPNWAMGSWQADIRIPATLPFLLIGASQPAIGRRVGLSVAALAIGLLGVRVQALAVTWADLDRQFSEFRAAIHEVPRGARLLVVQPEKSGTRPIPGMSGLIANHWNMDYAHMAALAVIERDLFIPYLFTGWTTIVPAGPAPKAFNTVGGPISSENLADALDPGRAAILRNIDSVLGEKPYWADWPRMFDYALWIDFGTPAPQVPAQMEAIHKGSFFRLYRIIPR